MLLAAWRLLRSTLGRGLAGIGALATLTWFLWPERHWQIHPDALAALIITLATWLASLTPTEVSKGTKHDRDLLAKFRAMITENEKSFLRDHDLAGSFSWRSMEGTRELAYAWRGAEYEFDDEDVQKKFAPIIAVAKKFIGDLSLGSWPVGPDEWSSTVPDSQRGGEISRETWNRIKDYNYQATALIDAINEFIKFARQRIEE